MDAVDHSTTYKSKSLKNFVHRHRLESISRIIDEKISPKISSYADFGCSNGFITNIIGKKLGAKTIAGFDWSDNVETAQNLYPDITFQRFNLNRINQAPGQFDLVTCFETLEHVGNIEAAIHNLLSAKRPDGFLLISVPIEIGPIGALKYLAKRLVFKYELPLNCSGSTYFKALLKGSRISKYRVPADGYGSHFGFDYRDVDEILNNAAGEKTNAWNLLTTRFYLLR